MADAFGRALLDHYHGEREQLLYQCDGDRVKTHPVGDFYFDDFETEPGAEWIDRRLNGPLVDLGAGAGRDTLHFQRCFETVALDHSDALVTLLDERGVDDPVQGDMFALPERFDPGRFRSVLAFGTQVGLAKSVAGLRAFLNDLATVTTSDATVVFDGYDPAHEGATDMLGFRADPKPGLAFRTVHYEYADLVGDTLLFRLFSPGRFRDVATETGWSVVDVHRPHNSYYYLIALEKRSATR
jgi:hypothetical protein